MHFIYILTYAWIWLYLSNILTVCLYCAHVCVRCEHRCLSTCVNAVSHSTLLFDRVSGLSWNLEFNKQTTGAAHKLQKDPPVFAFPALGLLVCLPCLGFYVYPGGLNSGPFVHQAFYPPWNHTSNYSCDCKNIASVFDLSKFPRKIHFSNWVNGIIHCMWGYVLAMCTYIYVRMRVYAKLLDLQCQTPANHELILQGGIKYGFWHAAYRGGAVNEWGGPQMTS